MLAVLAVCSVPCAGEIRNLDVSQSELKDNLWDGVNRNNELQVMTEGQGVLVDGAKEKDLSFGASPRVGDINGDGKAELIVSDALGFLWIYPLAPPGKKRAITPGTFVHTYLGDCATLALYDWNADNLLDIISGNMLGSLTYLKNSGNGVFIQKDNQPSFASKTAPIPYVLVNTTTNIGKFIAPFIADWNRDGKQDLIVGDGSYSANSIYLYLNSGSAAQPVFSTAQRYWLVYGMGKEHLVPAVGDLDGDGDLDLVVGEREGRLTLYLNEPQPAVADEKEQFLLTEKDALSFGGTQVPLGYLPRPELTDWDGDGDLDLLIGAHDGRVYLAENTGTPAAPAFAKPEALLSTDRLKPYRAPVGWALERHRIRSVTLCNSACVLELPTEQDENGTLVNYVRYRFVDRYVGNTPTIHTSGSHECVFGKQYTLVIRLRAYGVTRLVASLWHGERAKKSADTLVEGTGSSSIQLNPAPTWQTLRKGFKIKTMYKQNRIGNAASANTSLTFSVEGGPDAYCDIASVAFEEGGVTDESFDEDETPAGTNQSVTAQTPAAAAANDADTNAVSTKAGNKKSATDGAAGTNAAGTKAGSKKKTSPKPK